MTWLENRELIKKLESYKKLLESNILEDLLTKKAINKFSKCN